MGSCAAPSAKGDDKFITTDYLQQGLIYRMTINPFGLIFSIRFRFCIAITF
ncbi:integrase, partial [Proteus mirabilis]